eukprot:m.1179864 g.1179864  ORF g.1179864 m.1179864 type:complete len:312 (-) comp24529_c0_seq70:2782-3717(-)
MQYLQQIGRAHDARGGGVAPRLQPCHEPPHDRWDERGRRHVEVQWENLRCLGPPLVVAQRGVEVHVVVRRLEPCEQRRVFSDISVVLRQPCQIAQARHGEDVRPTRNLRPVNRLECQPVAVVPPRHQAEKRIHVARHEVHERFCCGVMLHRKGNVTSFDGHFPRHHGTHHHPRWVPGPASNVRERNHIREGTGCFIEAAAGQASVVAPKAIVGRIATHIHIGLHTPSRVSVDRQSHMQHAHCMPVTLHVCVQSASTASLDGCERLAALAMQSTAKSATGPTVTTAHGIRPGRRHQRSAPGETRGACWPGRS